MIQLDAVVLSQGPFELGPVSLAVPPAGYCCLMGPTGSGKTSLLEVVAGLRPLQAGQVRLRGADAAGSSPAARKLGYVPQDAAVFRTLSVRENLAFSPRIHRWSAAVIRERTQELAAWLGLTHLLDRRAAGLSGGEAQRVALGRALAIRPDVLLLDEPLAALDETTRDGIVELLRQVKVARQTAVLHVTHSRWEADRLADEVVRLP